MGIPWFCFSLHFLICACLVHLIWTNPWVALLFSLPLLRHIFPPSLPLRLILGWLPERIALQVRIPLRCRLYLLSLRYLILISYQHFTAASSSVFLSQRAEYVTGDGEGGSIKNSTNHSRRTLDGTVASLCCLPRTQSLILQCCVITLHSDTWPESKYSYTRWQIHKYSLPRQALLHCWLITY